MHTIVRERSDISWNYIPKPDFFDRSNMNERMQIIVGIVLIYLCLSSGFKAYQINYLKSEIDELTQANLKLESRMNDMLGLLKQRK